MAFIVSLLLPVCRTEQHIVSILSPGSSPVQDIFIPSDYIGEAGMKCGVEGQTKFAAVPKRRRGVTKK
jgi:hypothetical protein